MKICGDLESRGAREEAELPLKVTFCELKLPTPSPPAYHKWNSWWWLLGPEFLDLFLMFVAHLPRFFVFFVARNIERISKRRGSSSPGLVVLGSKKQPVFLFAVFSPLCFSSSSSRDSVSFHTFECVKRVVGETTAPRLEIELRQTWARIELRLSPSRSLALLFNTFPIIFIHPTLWSSSTSEWIFSTSPQTPRQ